jgi:hypothetical protein
VPVSQQNVAPCPAQSIAVRGGRRRRSLLLLPFAALLALVASLGAAPAASAAEGQALQPYTGPVTRAGKGSQPAPKGPDATAPNARQAIPLRTPDPAALRRAKERAASGGSGGGRSPQTISPLPKAAVFGGLNKAGMSAAQSGGSNTPPDTTGAIGPNHYVEFVNGTGITAYDRSDLSAEAGGPVALEEFIGRPSDEVFDPQIQWDPSWGRWIYATDDIESPTANFLAFGWSKTADPTNLSTVPGGGWCGYFIATGEFFDDYPKLGHSDSGLTIGTNVFDLSLPPNEQFQGSRLWSIAKPASPQTCPELGVGAIASTGALFTGDGDPAFTPVPANTADSSANSYVVAADAPFISGDAQVMGWHLTGAGTGATLFEDGNMSVSPFSVPASVPQPGTSEVIDSSDARLTNAVAVTDPDPAVEEEAVWTQHTVNGPGGRSVVRWYELLPGTQTVRQEGTISDSDQFVFNGAISPTAQGNAAAIDFNRGSASLSPEMRARSREPSTPLGRMGGDVLLGTSAGAAVDFSCKIAEGEPCRWGDYAGASPDPEEEGVVWGSNQGLAAPVGTQARWTTRNFALSIGIPVPGTTIDSGPPNPTNDDTPTFTFSSNQLSSTFECRLDGGGFSPCASPFTTPVLGDGSHTFQVRANDTGKIDPIPASQTFTVDTAAPAAPTINGTDPASPANNTSPKVKGSAEAGSTVRAYTSGDCSGTVAAEGSAASFGSPGLTVSVADNTTTQLSATATDDAGNTSSCSNSISYTESTPAPPPPPPPPPHGLAVAKKFAFVVRGKALLRLTCRGAGTCQGNLKLVARVKSRKGKGAKGSRKRVRNLVIGRARFSIAAGRTKTIRVRLTRKGKRLVRRARRRGLKVKLRGSGVANRTVRLRSSRKHRGAHRRAASWSLTILRELVQLP